MEERKEIPKVSPHDWLEIGEKGIVKAVVCQVYEGLSADGGHIEVVYLDRRDRAINADAKWNGTYWDFARDEPYGGYADEYPRLQPYVQTLRIGQR